MMIENENLPEKVDNIPSIDFKITEDDAQNILKATEALNQSISALQKRSTKNGTMDEMEVDTQENRTVTPDNDLCSEKEPIPSLNTVPETLLEAATSCEDRLLKAFISELTRQKFTDSEIQACLHIFFDFHVTSKIRGSFQSLLKQEKTNCEGAGEKDSLESAECMSLDQKSVVSLLRCLLTSICICVNDKCSAFDQKIECKVRERIEEDNPSNKARKENDKSSPSRATAQNVCNTFDDKHIIKEEDNCENGTVVPNKSPSFDVMIEEERNINSRQLSASTISDITEIAESVALTLCKDQLDKDTIQVISFEKFDQWLKSSGNRYAPWLKLFDLAEWHNFKCDAVLSNSPEKIDQNKPKQNNIKVKTENSSPRSEKKPNEKFGGSMPNFFATDEEKPARRVAPPSRTLVTFDFTGSSSIEGKVMEGHSPFCINITEDNLVTLKSFVHRTGLSSRNPQDMVQFLNRHSRKCERDGRTVIVLHKDDFGRCIRDIVPPESAETFSQSERESFSIHFINFFACYEKNRFLGKDLVDVKEFAVGLSLLCSGNKSTKLTNGFELLDEDLQGYLTEDQLTNYIRSYLTMLVGISLLSKNPQKHECLSESRKQDIIDAVSNGAKWTLNHFLRKANKNCQGKFTFESFACWYTDGGFNVAPWLELLDLRKLLSLLPSASDERDQTKDVSSNLFNEESRYRVSPRRRKVGTEGVAPIPCTEVLFTFPLAKERSLVVLREDATYVRSVVERLGLLSLSPDEVWSDLYDRVKKRPSLPPQSWNRSRHRKVGKGKSVEVDQQMFVDSMEDLMQLTNSSRNRASTSRGPTAKETLENFFQSFDLEQVNRVALNELMGGLSLLCGGKKSAKLAFSFGLFSSRKDGKGTSHKNPSLKVDELFIFLRSFLIVMFSCCRQSLDLSADAVSRYISETSHMVAEDVMRYQWHTRNKERVDFDEFGEWYNEGGFETAPWLELLDLNKWVLVENLDSVEHHSQPVPPKETTKGRSGGNPDFCPPPPPEDALDPSIFGEDDNPLMPMDSMDDMDLMLMQHSSEEKENNENHSSKKSSADLSSTPSPKNNRNSSSHVLKFHLVSYEDNGGYMISVSQKRVRHLRQILIESGLHKVDSEAACKKILSKASRIKRRNETRYILEKDDFDSAMRNIVASGHGKNRMSVDTQRALSDILAFIFRAFDRENSGKVDATEVACGFTVLCNGKKSDKLEYAFEVLDLDQHGNLDRSQISNYLRSFLTVLLCVTTSSHLSFNSNEDSILYMNGKQCSTDAKTMSCAADSGSTWASRQAFKGCYAGRMEQGQLNFDEFAEWYTRKGYSSIPWLELLDLRKWVITE